VVNHCLEQYLRCLCSQHPRQWENCLSWAEFWYNSSFHSTLGTTPFQALYGRPPPTVVNYLVGSLVIDEVDQALLSRDELLLQLKNNLQQASNRMKQLADKKRRDCVYEVDDWVFLRLQPYRQSTVFRHAHQKLASHFFGPYQILEHVGAVAYKLALPDTARVHPVFPVSLLEPKVGETSSMLPDLPPFVANHTPQLTPLLIRDYRWVKQGAKYVPEALVQWKSLTPEEATWEEVAVLCQQFPDINLEDKDHVQGVAIDRHFTVRTGGLILSIRRSNPRRKGKE
jgi:hypothetical protein